MVGKRLILQGNQIDPGQLADDNLPLKTLLAS